MAKHTRGPWVLSEDWPQVLSADGKTCIADCDTEANARLIAAAPELLEALKRAEHLGANVPVFSELLPSIRAAIAKAEGK